MRGSDGPVRSTSSKPTRAVGSFASNESASCTDTDDLPTPPLPDSTSRMCRICRSRVSTFSSPAACISACRWGCKGGKERVPHVS